MLVCWSAGCGRIGFDAGAAGADALGDPADHADASGDGGSDGGANPVALAQPGRHMAFRAKIILLCAEGTKSNKDVTRELRVGRGSVGKWRSRFITTASARTSRNRPPPQGSGSALTSYAASPDEVE